MTHVEVLVVGAGMAGASLAAEIAPYRSVLIVEAEDMAGRHATGRSAAFYDETYGGPGVQPLTSASGPLLSAPSQDMGGRSFLSPRGGLMLARASTAGLLSTMVEDFAGSTVAMQRIGRGQLLDTITGLLPDWCEALRLPACEDIDVAALHQAYLALARRRGARLLTRSPLENAIRQRDGRWRVQCGGQQILATILVNAAGAWADEVAQIAGARPLGIVPYRRTMVQLRLGVDTPASLPLCIDAAGSFYFKGEGIGRVWLSPHDETPDIAHDVAADELDVAVAIDRFHHVVDWPVAAVERRWAGLRSFAPDRLPVYGFAPDQPGFFWCAGQGGFGIQTAPAAARLSAALLLDHPLGGEIAMVDPAAYAPARFF